MKIHGYPARYQTRTAIIMHIDGTCYIIKDMETIITMVKEGVIAKKES